jgi:hypothetical protein
MVMLMTSSWVRETDKKCKHLSNFPAETLQASDIPSIFAAIVFLCYYFLRLLVCSIEEVK